MQISILKNWEYFLTWGNWVVFGNDILFAATIFGFDFQLDNWPHCTTWQTNKYHHRGKRWKKERTGKTKENILGPDKKKAEVRSYKEVKTLADDRKPGNQSTDKSNAQY